MNEQILSDGRTVTTTIRDAICQHMPSAAIASGFVTPVDFTHFLDGLWEKYGAEAVKLENLGITAVRDFLAAKGETVGERVSNEWRKQILAEVMRIETGGTPRHLPV